MQVKRLYSVFLFFPLLLQTVGPFADIANDTKPFSNSFINPSPPLLEENFSAVYDSKKVLVSWQSSPGHNFDYFTVEKAKDGIHFSAALMVKAGGHSTNVIDYRDTDYAPYSGVSYYRLKRTDYDGSVSYSPVTPVNFKQAKDGGISASEGKTLNAEELKKVEKKEVLVLVRDASGNEYTAKVKVTKEQDEKLYAQDVQNHLGKGSYLVLASSFNALYSQRLIVR